MRTLRHRFALAGLVAPLVLISMVVAAPAFADTPKALINADTVSGGVNSLEALAAVAAGLTVDVVDGSTWASMTATQFGAYQVLIAGDPTCGDIAASFASNVATWAPVVLGTAGGRTVAGNRVAIGTDPVYHQSQGGATKLIEDGIDYASSQPGRTGLYFDSSCGGFPSPDVAANLLQQVSTGTGTWTQNEAPPCGGSVAKIASSPKFDDINSLDLQGWSCSVHDTFPTFASDWHPLAVATDTDTHPVCGIDSVTGLTACGEPYILIAGSDIVVTSPNISLAPTTGSDPVGSTHTVTATVTDAIGPLSGQLVTFGISGPNAGAVGTCSPIDCRTDAAGHVTFTYSGTLAGNDTISASFTDASLSTQSATAAETWTAVVVNQPPVLTTANGSVQYSDAITPFNVSATDPENNPLTLGATGLPASLSFIDNANGTGTVSGTATAVPAVSTVTYSANDGTNPAVTGTGTVTVTKEDCTLTSPLTVLSAATGPTTLTATMGEPDASLGDRSGKTITFSGLDAISNPVGPFTATTNATGVASASAALGAGVYSINAAFAGDSFYNSCGTASPTIVTVSPAAFKVTGGGWVSNSVGRTSFGFNAITDVTGLHGQIQIRPNNGGKFHGNVVLTLTGTATTAQWTGTGVWNGVAGYKFTIAVVDAGTSGKRGDTIAITIKNPAGTSTVFTTSGSVPLKGGNIVVH